MAEHTEEPRVIRCKGSWLEIGRQYGEELRAEIAHAFGAIEELAIAAGHDRMSLKARINERFSSVQVTGRRPSMERCLRGLRAFHPAIAWPGLPGLGSMSAAGREIARGLRDGRFSVCDRCGPLCAGRRAWSPATVSSIGRSA